MPARIASPMAQEDGAGLPLAPCRACANHDLSSARGLVTWLPDCGGGGILQWTSDARDHWLNWGGINRRLAPLLNGRCQAQHPATCPHLQPARLPCLYYRRLNWAWATAGTAPTREPQPHHRMALERGPQRWFLSRLQTPCWCAAPITSPGFELPQWSNVEVHQQALGLPAQLGTTAMAHSTPGCYRPCATATW